MTGPKINTENTDQLIRAARETVRREAARLARDSIAQNVTRPMFRGDKEPTVRDVEPLAGARAARDIELAATAEWDIQTAQCAAGWEAGQ